jgi:hypothetical protein
MRHSAAPGQLTNRPTAHPVAKRRSSWAGVPKGALVLDDPDQMTAQQRHHEIATIFVAGVLRLRHRPELDAGSLTQIQAESSQNGLDVSADAPSLCENPLPVNNPVPFATHP